MNNYQYPEPNARREAAEERFRLGRLAVKEGRLAEAREYLLKAVEIDAQHSDAWLWLSATTHDAQEQKKYLEWSVAANPANPEARRGLAILQGRLQAKDLIPQGASVPPRTPAPDTQPTDAQQTFTCIQCGGVLRYDPHTTDLKCERCGHVQVIEEVPAKDVEQVLDFTLATVQGHRWAEAQRRMICQQCSATTIFPVGQTSGECPFCGSNVLIAARDEADLLPPQALILMAFEADEMKKRLRKWLGTGFFIPDDLSKLAKSKPPHPAYVPFWVFEATVNGKWQANVAEGSGKSRQWVWRTGEHTFFFVNELIVGTKQLPANLLLKTEPYDWDQLVEYKPEYLAGWPAVTYDIPLSQASLDARERMVAKAKKELLYKAAPGKDVRDLEVSAADFGGVTYKQVLLPLWIAAYTYRGKKYPVLINGQTGQVAGHKPTDSIKISLVILISVVVLLLLSFLIVILFGSQLGLTR